MKLIAIDMDGTLLTDRLEITEANKRAIQQAQRHNISVVIATGRPYAWAQKKLAEAGLSCPVIGSNGAELYGHDGSKLATIPLSRKLFADIQGVLEQERIYYEVYTNAGVFTENKEGALAIRMKAVREAEPHLPEELVRSKAEERFAKSTIIPVHSYGDVLNGQPYTPDTPSKTEVEIYKLLTCSYDSAKLRRCKISLEQIKELAISSSGKDNLEITNAAAQKGFALQLMAGYLGIPLSETAAIGDNHNDLQMLRMAGFSIAMDNAHDSIKLVCKHITLSNEESGVAYAIEKYCLDSSTIRAGSCWPLTDG